MDHGRSCLRARSLRCIPGHSRREPARYDPRMAARPGNFAAVVQRGSSLKPNTLAEISVTRLYGDFRQPKRPVAVLTMRFLFFDTPNALPGKVLLEREYARSIALKSATPAALMDGWNQALTQVLTQVISDFRHSESEEPRERAQLDLRKVP